MKYLILLISLSVNAQLQSDWNATEILEDMAVSWSVGNGCLEANYKVVNTNGLELNGNTLEVMDATIQVFGNVTNNGVVIDVLDSDLILYSCVTSEIIIYAEILNTDNYESEKLSLYPNPTSNKINIKGTFDYYTIFDINGKLVAKGIDNTINVNFLQNGLYFVLLKQGNKQQTLKFIKK